MKPNKYFLKLRVLLQSELFIESLPRLFICWAFTLIIFLILPQDHHDLRLSVRKKQKIDSQIQIVLLDLAKTELDQIEDETLSQLIKEHIQLISSFKPKALVVSFPLIYSNSILQKSLSQHDASATPVFWNAESMTRRKLNDDYSADLGFDRDNDDILRHFHTHLSGQTTLFQKLKIQLFPKNVLPPEPLINYRGPAQTYAPIFYKNRSEIEKLAAQITGKLVIFDLSRAYESDYNTPLGRMHRAEVSATILDNIIHQAWTRSISPLYSALIILIFISGIFYLTLCFALSASFPTYLLANFVLTICSVVLFDLYAIWIPLGPILIGGLLTFVVTQNLKLHIQEKKSWEFKKERDYLGQLDTLRNNFVSLISHDLKNPISKTQAIIDRMLGDQLSDHLSKDLSTLRSINEELFKYIQNILNLIAVESGQLPIRYQAVDINFLIQQAVSSLSTLSQIKHIKLVLMLEPQFSIEADPFLIKEVFINLIENSIKYSPSESSITIRSFEKENMSVVEISDQGIGIKQSEHNSVFKKFQRSSTVSGIEGTGLGLYLVKYFTELHRGTISLENIVPTGTLVRVTLPIAKEKK